MSPRCLVLGGAGFVGSGIVAALRDLDWQVAVAGRHNLGEFRDQEFDYLINANGNAVRFRANEDPLFDFEASLVSVYQSIFDFSFQHYVYISTVDVYPHVDQYEATTEDADIDLEGLHHYGFHKRLAELSVMRHCDRWLVLRLGQMVGAGLKKGPVFDLLQDQTLRIAASSRMPFLNTRSVGRLAGQLLQKGLEGEIINLCGRGSVALNRLFPLLSNPPSDQGSTRHAEQIYEINVNKLQSWCEVPDSWDEVQQYVIQQTAQSRAEVAHV